MVDDEAEVDVAAHGSLLIISIPPDAVFCLSPRTRASKSVSPFEVSPPFIPLTPPKFIKSLRPVAAGAWDESSWSLRFCSCSILLERDFISCMKDWNCSRLRRGPRLNCHKMGRTSRARNSESACLPTSRKTSRAAI